MTIELILPLIGVFMLGAMSPGPSLAVVLRNSVAGGRRQGVSTAIGHGLGFGVYAFLAALGMAAAIATSEEVFLALRWLGIALLIYLGYSYARGARSSAGHIADQTDSGARSGFTEGALIAVLNPKILAWMLAIYAPFFDSDIEMPVLLVIAAIGMIIDGSWYTAVALFLTTGSRSEWLRSKSRTINGALAVLMLVLGVVLTVDLLSG